MNAILSIVRSSFRSRKRSSTLLLLAVLVLASAGISAARTARTQAASVLDQQFERSQGPHIVVYSRRDTDAAVMDFLANDADVVDSIGPLEHLGVQIVRGRDVDLGRVMVFDPAHPRAIANPILRSGRWPSPAADGEIVVDHAYANDEGFHIGDRITVQTNGTLSLTVVGTALDFTDCYVPDCYPPRLYTSSATRNRLVGSTNAIGTMFLARTSTAADAPRVESRLRDRFGEDVGSDSWPDTRDDLLERDRAFGSFLRGFGFFVLVASSFVVGSALTARAVARRREVGLLKSIGFTRGQVAATVLAEHLLLGLVGAVAGWLFAGLLTARLRVGVVRLLIGAQIDLPLRGLVVTVIAVMTALAVATLLPALRWGRVSPDSALRDVPVGSTSKSRLAHALARAGAPLPAVLGAKDLSARPVRTLLTGATLVLAIIVAVMSIGLVGSMSRIAANPALTGDPWHAQSAIAKGMTREQFGAALSELPGVAGWYTDNDVKANIAGRPFLARVMGGPPEAARFIVRDGQSLTKAGQAIVGYAFMQTFHVGVGDAVTVSISGQQVPLTIVGWYFESDNSGVVLRLREESLPPWVELSPTDVRIVAADGVTAVQLADSVRARFQTQVGALTGDDESLDEFKLATKVMAAVIAAVVLAHLLASLITSARERARDLGVLRTIGLTNGQLVGQVASAAGLMALGALAIGLPLGWAVNSFAGDTLSKQIGTGPGLRVGPAVMPVVLAAIAIVVIAMAAGALAARAVLRQPTSILVRLSD